MKDLNNVECNNISAAQGVEFFIDPELASRLTAEEIDEIKKGSKYISELTEEDLTRLKALNFECDPHTAATTPWCNPIK